METKTLTAQKYLDGVMEGEITMQELNNYVEKLPLETKILFKEELDKVLKARLVKTDNLISEINKFLNEA